ncbi:hypothetical protein ACYF6T_44325 [Streptomyces sp. 7R007]
MVRDDSQGDDRKRAAAPPARDFTGHGHPGYTDRHERVLQGLAAAQEHRGGGAVHLEEIARASGVSPEEARTLLHDLTREHRLATELAGTDEPDMGPRFEVKRRL